MELKRRQNTGRKIPEEKIDLLAYLHSMNAHNHKMLKVIPKSWFSWDFVITEGASPIADIDVSWWREKGVLTVRSSRYDVYREGLMSGAFILESSGSILARAEKPSAFRRSFELEYGKKFYTLQAESAFRRKFVLIEGDREVGWLSPNGVFTRQATSDLPEEIPLPVQVFMIWLVVILWKRESDSAGAS